MKNRTTDASFITWPRCKWHLTAKAKDMRTSSLGQSVSADTCSANANAKQIQLMFSLSCLWCCPKWSAHIFEKFLNDTKKPWATRTVEIPCDSWTHICMFGMSKLKPSPDPNPNLSPHSINCLEAVALAVTAYAKRISRLGCGIPFAWLMCGFCLLECCQFALSPKTGYS